MRIAVLAFALDISPNRAKTFTRAVDSHFMTHAERQPFILDNRHRFAIPPECFLRLEYELSRFDYVYVLPTQCQFRREIGVEFLPTFEDQLVVVQHPQYASIPCNRLPYERGRQSSACVDTSEGMYYVTADIFGGSTAAFFDFVHWISHSVESDWHCGVVAKRQFESYLNRYVIDRPHCLFHSGYCYPSGWNHGEPKHIEVAGSAQRWHQQELLLPRREMSRAA